MRVDDTRYMREEMRHIVLKFMLLRMIKTKRTYSYELVKEISHNVNAKFIDPKKLRNDIYNTLGALEKSGYIRVKAKIENGRLKKYYSLTKKGEEVIKSAKRMFLSAAKLFK